MSRLSRWTQWVKHNFAFFILAVGTTVALSLTVHVRDVDVKRGKDARVQLCEYVNNHALKPLHDIIDLARTTSERNPLPPGLTEEQRAFYEGQRRQAQEFYNRTLTLTQPEKCAQVLKEDHQ